MSKPLTDLEQKVIDTLNENRGSMFTQTLYKACCNRITTTPKSFSQTLHVMKGKGLIERDSIRTRLKK